VLLGTCWGMYLRMHRSSHFFLALMTNVRPRTLTCPNDTHVSSHIDRPIRFVVLASPAHSLCCKCSPWHVVPTFLSCLQPHSVCLWWQMTSSSMLNSEWKIQRDASGYKRMQISTSPQTADREVALRSVGLIKFSESNRINESLKAYNIYYNVEYRHASHII
jgi:hypothetical protein